MPEYLTTEEVDQLENAIDLSKWEGQRNKAIIEVLFSCGLRVSELVNLKLSDLLRRRNSFVYWEREIKNGWFLFRRRHWMNCMPGMVTVIR